MTSHRRDTSTLLLVALLATSAWTTNAADWPLNGYAPCAEQPTRILAGPWGDNLKLDTADIAFNDDTDVLWVGAEGSLYKFRYSDGALLSSLDLATVGIGSSMSVAAMGSGRAAVADGMAKKIVLVGSEGDMIVVDKEIDISFAPSNIAYDGAYELFYVVDKEADSDASEVMVVDMDGDSRSLFNFGTTNGIDPGFIVSSLHYAPNTGTLFALCQECGSIAEVTLSGRLRQLTVSGASILFLKETLGYEPGQVLGVSFARLGSPMLLLKDSLEVDVLCQDILPSLPVLPPPKAGPQTPISWFPLANYFFCGAVSMEQVTGTGFKTMVIDSTLRTIWAMVGGRLREYSLRGELLRQVDKETLQGLGISDVTSMAWVRKNQLLLGMKTGNKIAHINTAPKDVMDNLAATYRALEGDPSLPNTDSWEPAGEEAEEETIRTINKVDLVNMYTLDSEIFGISPNKLGAIFYNHFAKNIFFTTRNEGTVVRAMDMMGAPVNTPLDEQVGDVPPVDVLTFSHTKDSFLMLNKKEPVVSEVMRAPAELVSTKRFPSLANGVSGMTTSSNGALLLLATAEGELNAFCGSPNDEEDELVKSIRNGVLPDLDIAYFMRLSEIADEQDAEEVAATRSFEDDKFTMQWATECTDPDYYTVLGSIELKGACEQICRMDPFCGAYNYSPSLKRCQLKFACNSKLKKKGVNSGVKVNSKSSPPAVAPPPAKKWRRINYFECLDENLQVLPGRDREFCQWTCGQNPKCGSYTVYPGKECHIKGGPCKKKQVKWVARSGAKVDFSTAPPPTPTSPSPSPRPVSITYTILEMVGCKDDNREIKRGVTVEACQSACASDDSCQAYTFNTARGDCFLKTTCERQLQSRDDVTGLKPGVAVVEIGSKYAINRDGRLIGGFEWREGKDCSPWENRRCGLSENPGLKVGDLHWYRMFAHKANPMLDDGGGVMAWTPFRERRPYGEMYWKGSEILGYFDNTWDISREGDEAEIKFKWMSEGSTQDRICGGGDAKNLDCKNDCEEQFEDETGERYIYHEVRCLSGTGDFRLALLDSSKAERIEKDGYGYYNKKLLEMRGLQWRFHPHACPEFARVYPYGYDAVACQSWIRNEIKEDWLNSHALTLDYIEREQSEWHPELGDTRSFEDRMMGPPDDGACMNLPNGQWTPDDKPLKIKIKILDKSSSETKFLFRLEFNGYVQEHEETYDNEYMPQQIDSIAIGYTNPRSFTMLKLEHISDM